MGEFGVCLRLIEMREKKIYPRLLNQEVYEIRRTRKLTQYPQLVRVGQEHNKLEIIPTFGAGTLLITQRAQVGRSDLNLFLAPSSPSSSSPSPSSSSSSPSEPEPSASASARADTPSSPPLNQATSTASSRSQQQQQRANARSANSSNALDSASKITPLAVLNTFETAWLGDKYGVWGKSKYAGEWFESLDWQRIFDRVRR